ncbi:MAG TPA: hypothetical protein VG074_09105 [Acidimicrobiales bacterium]|jgi:hypothetical protein|nr:hypothetical protein [Acidimicrobiales bacterium]
MWFSRRAVGLHVLIIVIVPVFAALCVWQVRRALGGNELSWAYVFEWPFFAGYAIYMWWRFIHEAPLDASAPTARSVEVEADPVADRDEAAERAAYNNYLAELAARDKPKQWR